jgi:thiamine biosynthesis lipoprotein
VLIDIGEYRAFGTHPDGRPWRIGLPGGTETLLSDAALATSEGAATRFTATAPHHHLFDPRTGFCAPGCTSLSIVAASATDADALSTALFVAPPQAHSRILRFFPGAQRVSIG